MFIYLKFAFYLVNESGLNEKIKISTTKEKIKKKIATKAELNAEQDKIVKLQTYDSSFLLVEVTLSMMEHNLI